MQPVKASFIQVNLPTQFKRGNGICLPQLPAQSFVHGTPYAPQSEVPMTSTPRPPNHV